MEAFWSDYIWPLVIMVAESLLLLVILLDRDRLRPVGRPENLGGGADQARAERGRTMGAVSVIRRPVEIRAQGAGHSGRRQQRRVSAGAARDLHAGASRLGGDSGGCGHRHRQHQCRRPLHLRHLLADGLRRDHGRLVVELEISVPRGVALGGANGVVRSLDRICDHYRAALRRLAEPLGHRRGTARSWPCDADRSAVVDGVELVLAAATADVPDFLRLRTRRDQPPAVRSGRSGIRTGRRLSWSNTARRHT